MEGDDMGWWGTQALTQRETELVTVRELKWESSTDENPDKKLVQGAFMSRDLLKCMRMHVYVNVHVCIHIGMYI